MSEKLKILITGDAKDAAAAFKKVEAMAKKSMSGVSVTSIKAAKSLNKVEHAAHGAHGGMSGMVVSMLAMSAAFAGWREAQAIVQSSMDMQSIMSKLAVGTGDAAAEFEHISGVADRLGLDLRTTADDYAKLTAASIGSELEGQATRDIFEGISTAAVALNLSTDQTSGALKAIEQMMSKGNVQAEELRGQLGERLPGAFNLAASAMGVSTAELNKMLDRGQVLATDLLPALADELKNRFGPAALAAAKAPQAQFNRLATSVFKFNKAIGENGATQAVANLSGVMADLFNKNEAVAESIGESLVNGLEYAIVGGAMLAKGFESMGVAMDASRVVLDGVVLTTVEGFDIMLAGLDKFYGALSLIPGETGQVYTQAQKDIQSFRSDIELVKKGIIATGAESLNHLEHDYNTFGDSVDAVAQKMFNAIESARGQASIKIVKRTEDSGTTASAAPSASSPAVNQALADAQKIIDIHSLKFQQLQILGQAAFSDEQTLLLAKNDADMLALEDERQRFLDATEIQIEDKTARKEALAGINDYYDQQQIDRAQQTSDAIVSIDAKNGANRLALEAKFNATATGMKKQLVSSAIGFMKQMGQSSKAFQTAAIVAEAAYGAASIFVSSQAAAAAALMPPPLGLGPVLGAPLAATISTVGIASSALVVGSAVARLASGGGSGFSSPAVGGGSVGGSSSGGAVAQPSTTPQQQPQNQSANIVLNVQFLDPSQVTPEAMQMMADSLAAPLNDAFGRGQHLAVQAA